MIPPTMRIGAEIDHRQRDEDQRLDLLDIVRVADDEGRRAEAVDLGLGEALDRGEDRAAHVTAEAHRDAGPEVHRGHRREREREGDDEHQPADAEDEVGVALGDALIDDLGVERRQVQVADGTDEQQAHDQQQLRGIRAQVGPEEADHRGASGAGVVASAAVEPAGLSAMREMGRCRRPRLADRAGSREVAPELFLAQRGQDVGKPRTPRLTDGSEDIVARAGLLDQHHAPVLLAVVSARSEPFVRGRRRSPRRARGP